VKFIPAAEIDPASRVSFGSGRTEVELRLARDALLQRDSHNPVLTAADWPATINAVFNPGAAQVGDETVLLVRVEERTGLSYLCVARSRDGLGDWIVEPERVLRPETHLHSERYGIEDPRITVCDDEYLIVYTAYSTGGPVVALAATRDFFTFHRRGILMPPEDKDAALFPQRFGNRWALIHRPVSTTPNQRADIWLSWSPDLRHWGDHEVLLHAREGGWWDAHKVGLNAPPLLTNEGWLLLYHGVRVTAAGSIYRLGLALLDRERPDKVLARSNEWIFGPEAPYERSGDVGQVVFPCGWILGDDGDTIRIYYGAADTSICVATASLRTLLAWLATHSS
jgi:predicted GH43/DUF377 family glycosyl hydrolase